MILNALQKNWAIVTSCLGAKTNALKLTFGKLVFLPNFVMKCKMGALQ